MSLALTIPLLLLAGVAAALGATTGLRARRSAGRRTQDAVRRFADGAGFTDELAATLDARRIVVRVLDTAAALPGVDGAIVHTLDGASAVAGVSPEEAERLVIAAPPDPNLRSAEIALSFRLDDAEGGGNLVRSAVIVPLRAEGESFGTLLAVCRSLTERIPQASIAALELLARQAGPALDNAHRFAEARRLADLDSLTGLANRRAFHESLMRECARATRYGRKLSLIVFDLDDFKSVNDHHGHLAGDAVLAEVALRVKAAVRATDIPCRVGGDEFAVILPESGSDDALLLSERIAKAVAAKPIANVGHASLSAGVAEINEGDDSESFFNRADAALYRAKGDGKARTVAG
jgi:diguanylate cyclase (GGDEF)-like protein